MCLHEAGRVSNMDTSQGMSRTSVQTCMAEVPALHEVILDDGVVLLDKSCQSGSMAVSSQLFGTIQGMRVLQWHIQGVKRTS